MRWFWRPSKLDPDGSRDLSREAQARLLNHLGINDIQAWTEAWAASGAVHNTLELWPETARSDWLWSLGLPLLSEAERHQGQRWLIGLSALPGCGKTSLGRWLEAAAAQSGVSLQVVSIDDFYFSAAELEQSMRGNPWGVPRALPGSHELDLLNMTLQRWKAGESVRMPVFDKALRQGRGDRSGWRICSSDVLVLEGWFVGVRPQTMAPTDSRGRQGCALNPPLSSQELAARRTVQTALAGYIPTWDQLDSIWQLRATQWNAPDIWKRQQEEQMLRERGSGLNRTALNGFIRMITAAIPEASFNRIRSDVCFDVDPERRLRQLRVRSGDQDSLSSASATG